MSNYSSFYACLWQQIRNYWTGAKMFGEGEIDTALDQAVTKMGYLDLRREQELAVKKFAMGNDVFVSLPTGSGKSVCYGILPIVFDLLRGKPGSVVVVVSPLISLMKDQVVSMKKRGINAVYYGEADPNSDDQSIASNIASSQFQILYLSPESLLKSDALRDVLQSPHHQENLVALVIDEAHCVKKW